METYTLPKPKLDRDGNAPYAVRLSFAAHSLSGLWTGEFKKTEHGVQWPDELPKPYYENGHIVVTRLRPDDVERFIEVLREHVDATNQRVEQQLPALEAQHRESEERQRKFDDDVSEAERKLDELFPAD